MSDELNVVVSDADSPVTVPQPAVDVLVVDSAAPVVLESPVNEVVVLDEDVNVVESIPEISILTVGEPGPSGADGTDGVDGVSGSNGITRTAGIAVGGHRVVVLDASEQVIYADSSDTSHADKILGVTTGAASMGASVAVQTYGEMEEPSFAFTPGASVYVGTNGLMTQTSPAGGFTRAIGYALAATKLFIDLGTPTIRI